MEWAYLRWSPNTAVACNLRPKADAKALQGLCAKCKLIRQAKLNLNAVTTTTTTTIIIITTTAGGETAVAAPHPRPTSMQARGDLQA